MQMTKLSLLLPACVLAATAAAQTYNFPPPASLPENPNMPDPFKTMDGTRVSSLHQWPRQRAYLRAMLEYYLYGRVPPRPTGDELSFSISAVRSAGRVMLNGNWIAGE